MPGSRLRYCSRCLTTFPGDVERCPNLACRAVRPPNNWGELLEPGDVLDRTYRIIERLAIGGAGVTYLSRELDGDGQEIGPKVAIKLLYQQRDQGPYLRRLATEAQIIQGLNHANIVEYRGFVHRAGHSPYLITRYEEGGSLLDHVHRVGVLSVPIVAAIGKQICDALVVAHSQGVIHRDLKPENVLLERQVLADVVPRLRLADFGIAKVFGGVGDRLTRVGAFIGTPQFAAPEQFEGAQPEPNTDVYATGAMLYYCLMGKPVAGYMDQLEPEQQLPHLISQLPPKLVRPDLPAVQVARMEEVLAAAMRVDPSERCTMPDLGRLLAELAAAEAPPEVSGRQESLPSPPKTKSDGSPHPRATWSGEKQRMVNPPDEAPREEKKEESEARPVPTRTRERASGGGGGAGIWAVGIFLLLSLLVVGTIGVGLWWRSSSQAPMLDSKDPEWRNLAAALGTRGKSAAVACKAPPYMAVEITVEPNGRVTQTRLTNYNHEPTRACMHEKLAAYAMPRTGKETVRVAVTLQK